MAITTWRAEFKETNGGLTEEEFTSAIIGEPVYGDYSNHPIKFNSILINDFNDPRFQEFLDKEFDSGHGLAEGIPFRIYTTDRIYFSHAYDGAEWIEYLYLDPKQYLNGHISTIA